MMRYKIILCCLAMATLTGVARAADNISVETKSVYPESEWVETAIVNLDIDTASVDQLFNLSFQDAATQGAALFIKGKLIKEKYAEGFNKDSMATSWSMAKSFYAALIGISIDRGEIGHLDEKVSQYLDYFKDNRRDITIRQLLNMTSGLEMSADEHEKMFLKKIIWPMPKRSLLKVSLVKSLNITM